MLKIGTCGKSLDLWPFWKWVSCMNWKIMVISREIDLLDNTGHISRIWSSWQWVSCSCGRDASWWSTRCRRCGRSQRRWPFVCPNKRRTFSPRWTVHAPSAGGSTPTQSASLHPPVEKQKTDRASYDTEQQPQKRLIGCPVVCKEFVIALKAFWGNGLGGDDAI